MNRSQFYIAATIVVLLTVAALVFFVARRSEHNKLTPLAGLAWAFVLAGIIFGDNRIIGYGLMAIGVILTVVDIFRRSRSR